MRSTHSKMRNGFLKVFQRVNVSCACGMASVEARVTEGFANITVPDQLVAPVPSGAPPNALTERKFFTKLGQSKIVKAEPKSIHFAGFIVGHPVVKVLKLTNASSEVQRWHIIPPVTPYFKVTFQKPERCVPGMFMEMKVIFSPDEWRYYHDTIRIHCRDEENIIVPIHAYPVMSGADELPESVTLPITPLGETSHYKIPLTCTAPIDFQFQIRTPTPHIAFTVVPMEGLVPANGSTEITVSFTPKEFNTAVMKLELLVSQFATKPLSCIFVGHSLPGHHKFMMEKKHKPVKEEKHFLESEEIRAIDKVTKKTDRAKDSGDLHLLTKSLEMEYNGHRFPLNLNNVHAVNYVLTQQKGKLKIKDLKHVRQHDYEKFKRALEKMRKRGGGTKQMKEAVFETAVRQVVLEERANNLRWQNHLGAQPMSQKAREVVLEDRNQAHIIYKNETRLEPIAEEEYEREKTKLLSRRTYRKADDIPPQQALFDHYKTNLFAKRHFAKERFKLAVRKAMIQYRCEKRVVKTRQLISDFKSGLVGKPKEVTYFDEVLKEGVDGEGCALKMDARRVEKVQFPVYEKPGHKDDMAPDAVGRVPVKATQVEFRRQIPTFELSVGKQYELLGYSQYSIYEHRSGYVRPGLARPLRTDAHDEIVKVPLPLAVLQSGIGENFETPQTRAGIGGNESLLGGETATTTAGLQRQIEDIKPMNTSVVESRSITTLIPPPYLTRPVEYHPLHIFNPMPGLLTFERPIAYSEVDPDFHLCPVPRYTLPCSKDGPDCTSVHVMNPHMSTQKKYVDEEDVIRGVMTWKKYPSHSLLSLANTTTLAGVYAPRLTDPFTSDVIPTEGPPLLSGLPYEDSLLVSDVTDSSTQVTPETVARQFALASSFTEKDGSILSGSKMPSTHHNLTSRGQPSRFLREYELEKLMEQSGGGVRLGTKIDEKMDKYTTLCSNHKLILK